MRPVLTFLLPALTAVTLAACGSSSSSSTTTSSSQPATASTPASAAVLIKTASIPALHSTALVNAQGMTLYHLSGEVGGKFICTSAACVQVWHPVSVAATVTPSGVSALGTVKRPNGSVQVTYKGTPLYTFAGDKQPGEAKGQDLKDVGTWTAVTTGEGTPASETKPATTTPSSSGGSESSGSGGYGY